MLHSMFDSLIEETHKTKKRISNIKSLQKKSLASQVAATPYEVLGHFGRCRLLYFAPLGKISHPPLFVVPSIINKYYILDLMKGVSFIEHLVQSGIPVYLIDWGEPRVQDRLATIEDHIMHWMDWAIKQSCLHAHVEKIDIFGQCIGGTFGMIYTALKPTQIKSLITLTAPVNFHDEGLLSTWTKHGQIDLDLIGHQWGNVYKEFLKESFNMLRPVDRLRKYNTFFKLAWNDKFLERYLAINKWVDDCIAFPGSTYVKYIKDFYQNNKLIKNQLQIGSDIVDLKKITCPVLVISSKEDNIVPFESAMGFLNCITSEKKVRKEIKGGHIGLLLSSKVKENLWMPVEEWVKEGV